MSMLLEVDHMQENTIINTDKSITMDFAALSMLEDITVEDMEKNIVYVKRTSSERKNIRAEFIKAAREAGF